MGHVKGLICKECRREFPKEAIHVCEFCFGPLEVDYDYETIKKVVTKKSIESGPPTMWRYEALLPLDEPPKVGLHTGFTPLVRAKNLGKALGLNNLYLKNDSVNHPTFSFKDRVVSVAVSKAIEFGFDTISCASTGNLANSVAAHAAEAGLKSCIFIPDDLEAGKILGTLIYGSQLVSIKGSYDDVNRLCSEIGANHNWAFVNINIRPYYGDGSKSYGYEIAEQLGWKTPDNVVVPVAGSSLITKIWKAFHEFEMLGLVDKVQTKIFAAQATGCSPVTTAIKNGTENIVPVKPNTIAKSIAIGNPADGYYGIKTANTSGGYGEDISDEEIVTSMKLLAETEGIFTETAGGVTVGVTQKLVQQGRIKPDEVTVICITGNGLKTQEALAGCFNAPIVIEPKIDRFEEIFSKVLTV
ncbi:MAG TPA: threonine synthase [Nitrospinaceae bacterium]|jgi:threonine synthase|nr:threonine synthase [Nitrospinaceae bacterium]